MVLNIPYSRAITSQVTQQLHKKYAWLRISLAYTRKHMYERKHSTQKQTVNAKSTTNWPSVSEQQKRNHDLDPTRCWIGHNHILPYQISTLSPPPSPRMHTAHMQRIRPRHAPGILSHGTPCCIKYMLTLVSNEATNSITMAGRRKWHPGTVKRAAVPRNSAEEGNV